MLYVLCITFGFAFGSSYANKKVQLEKNKSIFKRSDK